MNSYRLTRRSAMKTISASAAGVLAGSVAPRRSSAQTAPKIFMGTLPITPSLATYSGEVDVFKEAGLAVELTRFNNGAQILQGMATGDIVAGDMGLPLCIIGLLRGLQIVVPFLASFVTPHRPLERIMVSANSPIKTLDDLKGKKLAFLGPGTVPDMELDALPTKNSKISKADIQLVPMPAPNMPDALGQGLVDAIFAIPPADTVAERKYGARTLINSTELVPYIGPGTITVRWEFAESNPEATKRLFRSLIRLARWVDDHDAAARQVMARNLGLPDDLAGETRMPPFARNGLPVMPNVWNIYEMLVRAKAVEPHPDPAKLFNEAIVEPTRRFTLSAAEELGLQPDPEVESMLKGEYPYLPKPVASYYADWERRLLKM